MKFNQRQFNRWVMSGAILGGLTTGSGLLADETADVINGLKKQIEQLDQKVKVLERNREIEVEAADAKVKTAPTVSVGDKGFSFGSADGNFNLKIRGLLQADSRAYFSDGGINNNDSFLLRRARPIIEGTVFRDFEFQLVPEFGGTTPSILEANFNYRYTPALQLRLGKFKTPVGLEQLQSDSQALFIERGLPTNLTPNRDVGVQLWGDVFDGILSYAAGIFNGVGDNRNTTNGDFDDDKEFAGRVFVHPFKKTEVSLLQGLGFGLGGGIGNKETATGLPNTTGGALAGFVTDSQQQFFAYNPTGGATIIADGEHVRIAPQAYYYHGPFGLLGEYVISSQKVRRTAAVPLRFGRIDNCAWQIAGSYVLTGEDATFKGVTPRKPFDPSADNWGALEAVARYGTVQIDPDAFPNFSDPATSARSATSWAVGLNWWLNRNVRFSTSFSRTTFSGAGGAGATAPATVTRQNENVLLSRLQLSF